MTLFLWIGKKVLYYRSTECVENLHFIKLIVGKPYGNVGKGYILKLVILIW